jgi:hypothetical protein
MLVVRPRRLVPKRRDKSAHKIKKLADRFRRMGIIVGIEPPGRLGSGPWFGGPFRIWQYLYGAARGGHEVECRSKLADHQLLEYINDI